MQFTGSPFLTLRHEYPLEPIWSSDEVQNKDCMVPFVRFDPTAIGFSHTYRHGTNIPGNFQIIFQFIYNFVLIFAEKVFGLEMNLNSVCYRTKNVDFSSIELSAKKITQRH